MFEVGDIGSIIEVEGISWIVLEKRNGVLCMSKEILGRAAFGEELKQEKWKTFCHKQKAVEWKIPSISDYKKFRFLLCLVEDWWLSNQSSDGSIAFVGRDGRIGWSNAFQLHGVRYQVRFKEVGEQ